MVDSTHVVRNFRSGDVLKLKLYVEEFPIQILKPTKFWDMRWEGS